MPKVVFLITKDLLLFYGFGWLVGLGWVLGPNFHYGMGWVEKIGPTDNSAAAHRRLFFGFFGVATTNIFSIGESYEIYFVVKTRFQAANF